MDILNQSGRRCPDWSEMSQGEWSKSKMCRTQEESDEDLVGLLDDAEGTSHSSRGGGGGGGGQSRPNHAPATAAGLRSAPTLGRRQDDEDDDSDEDLLRV